MRNYMKKLFCLSLILLSVSFSQGVVAQMEKGSVNYSEQTISAMNRFCANKCS